METVTVTTFTQSHLRNEECFAHKTMFRSLTQKYGVEPLRTGKSPISFRTICLKGFIYLMLGMMPAFSGYGRSMDDSGDLARYVNPFIGTAEGQPGKKSMDNPYTNPGAVLPWGMMSISPFNIY
ncbi:MAG: hypothetical protein LBL57_11580, partial [Tannerella sp.]|nr:hypothetical protein [Tannerella sp.]